MAQDDVHGESGGLQPDEPHGADSDILRETVKRYFQRDSDYRLDDLIVRSQVEELQVYFRRTRGQTRLSNPRLRKNVLSDNNLLARTFFSSEGHIFLRKVAKSLGGYERLDRLCMTAMGRKTLTEMVASGDDRALVKYILAQEGWRAHQDDLVLEGRTSVRGPHSARNRQKIYSVDDLLQVLISTFLNASPSPEKLGTTG